MKNSKDVINWYLTSPSGERIKKMEPIEVSSHFKEGLPVLHIVSDTKYQEIKGFGGTFNESGWYLLNLLDEERREKILESFFDKTDGAGFSVCAAPVGHNDYSLSYYSYNETEGDVEMKNFSIERDKENLIPYIKSARKFGSFSLATRPDYPPQWMLDGERKLKKEYYSAYAMYLLEYVRQYEKEGIHVDYLSVFNEPFIYMQITAEEIAELIKNHIGPLFKKNGISTGIQASDSYDRTQSLEEWPVLIEDKDVREYLSAITYHAYWWERNPSVITGKLHEKYPDVPIWQTEVMNLYTTPIYEYADGEVWGKMVADDLCNGVSAWIFWNMLVDEEGGPWNKDPFNTGYEQDGIVVVNKKDLTVTYTAKYYYFSHFSRFIRPGAVRIESHAWKEGSPFPENAMVWCRYCSFINPDGTIVLVVVNTSSHSIGFCIAHGGNYAEAKLPGHSIATYVLKGIG